MLRASALRSLSARPDLRSPVGSCARRWGAALAALLVLLAAPAHSAGAGDGQAVPEAAAAQAPRARPPEPADPQQRAAGQGAAQAAPAADSSQLSAEPRGVDGDPAPASGERDDAATPRREGIEEITITGTRSERPLFSTPAAVLARGAEQLEREQPSTFADVLEGMPGVSVHGGARRIAQEPSIRGFSGPQIAVRVDGARQNFDLAHRGRFFTDPDLLQSVEVLRGPGSSLYGSGALGGVIALRTLRPADLLREGESLGARYRFGYQSNGREALHSLGVFGRGGWLDGMASLTLREGRRDLRDGDGVPILASRDAVEQPLLQLGLTPSENQRLEWSSSSYRNRGDNPSSADAPATAQNIVERDMEARSDQLLYRYRSADSPLWDVRALVFRNSVDSGERRFFDGRADQSDFGTRGLELSNTARLQWGAGVQGALTFGAETYRDTQRGARAGAPRAQYPDAQIAYRSAFAQLELGLGERWSIVPGLRYDAFALDADGFADRRERQLSPRLALGLELDSGVYLWGGLSRAFRAPSLTELYAGGVHFAAPLGPDAQGRPQFVVNEFEPSTGLGSESADTAELGLRWERAELLRSGDQLRAEVALFQARVDGFIDSVVTFMTPEPPVVRDGQLFFRGTTRSESSGARLRGLELLLRYDTPHLAFALGGSALGSRSRRSGEGLASTPADSMHVSLYGSLPGWETLVFGGRASFARRQGDLPSGAPEAPDYQSFDVSASWTPAAGALEGLTLTLALNNAFDRAFRIHPSQLPQPGRSLRVSALYRFGVGGRRSEALASDAVRGAGSSLRDGGTPRTLERDR